MEFSKTLLVLRHISPSLFQFHFVITLFLHYLPLLYLIICRPLFSFSLAFSPYFPMYFFFGLSLFLLTLFISLSLCITLSSASFLLSSTLFISPFSLHFLFLSLYNIIFLYLSSFLFIFLSMSFSLSPFLTLSISSSRFLFILSLPLSRCHLYYQAHFK